MCVRLSRSVSFDRKSVSSYGTTMRARSVVAGTSTIVVCSSATTFAVRRLPVRAAISPKKSPASIEDREQ